MAVSRKTWSIIAQFVLIIIIGATISGIVGGVTNKVQKATGAEVVFGNSTGSGSGMGRNKTVSGCRRSVMRMVGVFGC